MNPVFFCTNSQCRHRWSPKRNRKGRLPQNWRQCPVCPAWLSRKEANRQVKGIYPSVPQDFVPRMTTTYDPRMHCWED
jgi:hypothetical protein